MQRSTSTSRFRKSGLTIALGVAAAPLRTASATIVWSGPLTQGNTVTYGQTPVDPSTPPASFDVPLEGGTNITVSAYNYTAGPDQIGKGGHPIAGTGTPAVYGFSLSGPNVFFEQDDPTADGVDYQSVPSLTNLPYGTNLSSFFTDGVPATIDSNGNEDDYYAGSSTAYQRWATAPTGDGYFGFYMQSPDLVDQDGNPRYLIGWGQLEVDPATDTLTLLQYAYDDSGAALSTGDTGAAVPEPASLGLIGMASGAALLRRRRKPPAV